MAAHPSSAREREIEEQLHLALIDDDAVDRQLCRQLLRHHRGSLVWHEYETVEAALESDVSSMDCVLLDLNLPGSDGFQFLSQLGGRTADPPPVIVVSAVNEAQTGVRALRAGAVDYLHKEELTRGALENAVSGALANGRKTRPNRRTPGRKQSGVPSLHEVEYPFPRHVEAYSDAALAQRKGHLESIALTYESLTRKWQQQELRRLWGRRHAKAMSTECWALAMAARVELLKVHRLLGAAQA